MGNADDPDRWARCRFAIIGPLLAAPPPRGELQQKLLDLSNNRWKHPVNGTDIQFSVATLERWFYAARLAADPVAALRRQRRSDAGRARRLTACQIQAIEAQYQLHKSWTVQLHVDNLQALAEEDKSLQFIPSYGTIRRYMKAQGHHRKRMPKRDTPGARMAEQRLQKLEVRSYEADYVHSLWHADFHHGSRQILLPSGRWVTPLLLGFIDDHSRLVCHLQWYLDETAETLVHGLCQALQKRALPRALMTDNGAAMQAEEFKNGLHALGILHETTLPYSPYQNAKQEVFWATLEGRLMAMLEGVKELSLDKLNEITQVWVEQEYHQNKHAEIGTTPLRRYLDSTTVGRDCPGSQTLRQAFRCTVKRRQRRSDGTLSLSGKRFEIPARYRHIEQPLVRYARWDLSCVDLIDEHTQQILCPLYPLDKSANASGQRRALEQAEASIHTETAVTPANELPPLLRKLMADYAATGQPPAYLPKTTPESD
ncbi:MAG: transposase [Gammaproteobacteria bacterium]|nr:transposase [Gammaproteobacteria bacterium]